ncbi:hypothetical protein JHK82_039134 [Glycine max]|nr:hypothetical protein JHK86_039314 [Glycine max]KAG5109911.1 hypothetical protein JHK82_039134 [Glycine max]KAG5121202.1 hypothetical protein JHK84_039542 [Glycine max]
MKYSADEAAQWGIFSWVTTTNGGTPLLDAFNHASSDMVDSHISSLFKLSIQKITISLSRFAERLSKQRRFRKSQMSANGKL